MLHLDHGPAALRALPQRSWPGLLAAATATGTLSTVASVAVSAGVIPEVGTGPLRPQLSAALARDGRDPLAVLLAERVQATRRGADLVGQGRAILAALATAGVPAVPLKGLDLALRGVWPDPAARSMADLDILVDGARLPAARRALIELGYRHLAPSGRMQPTGWLPGDHHDPPMVCPGRSGTVELHRHLLSRAHRPAMVAPDALARRRRDLLAEEDLLAHLVAHAQLSDGGLRLCTVPLRSALDVAYLLRRFPELSIDAVAQRYPYLRLALEQQLADAARFVEESPPWTVRWRAAGWLVRHPRAHQVYRRATTAHRSLAPGRMAEIYGVAPAGLPLAAARAQHGLRYAQHRLALPAQRRPVGPFDFADAILCINLDGEVRRWDQMRERFAALGIADRVERVPAIPTPDNHHRGCAWSWWTALKLAYDRGYDNVLVFEDDAMFLDTTDEVMRQVNRDLRGQAWDLLYLGAAAWCQLFPFLLGSRALQSCTRGVTCCHAMAVHRRAIPRILTDIPGPHEPEAMRAWLDEWLAIDQYLSRHIDAGTFHALITWPRVASQPPLLRYPDGDLALADRYVI